DNAAVGFLDFIGDRRRGLDHLDMELALEAFLYDLHVEQAQEAATKAKAERIVGFGLEAEAGVVEAEAIHRVAELVVLRFAGRVEVAIDHLLDRLVAGELLGGGVEGIGDGVADADIVEVLDRGDDETDLARADALDLLRTGHE